VSPSYLGMVSLGHVVVGWDQSTIRVPVRTLVDVIDTWAASLTADDPSAVVPKLLYAVIDTEGHEPCVLMGMALQHAANRQRFSAFQYGQETNIEGSCGQRTGARQAFHIELVLLSRCRCFLPFCFNSSFQSWVGRGLFATLVIRKVR
jgi:hypothetical protein